LIRDSQLSPLPCVVDFIAEAVFYWYIEENDLPPILAEAYTARKRAVATPTQESLASLQHPPSAAPVETVMDVDASPESASNSQSTTSSTVPAAPDVEIRVGPPGSRVVKRPRVDSDIGGEGEQPSQAVDEKKKKGKGKKTFAKGKAKKRTVPSAENFEFGDLTVIMKGDDIEPVDLREETVTALTPIDFDKVPFLAKTVCRSLC